MSRFPVLAVLLLILVTTIDARILPLLEAHAGNHRAGMSYVRSNLDSRYLPRAVTSSTLPQPTAQPESNGTVQEIESSLNPNALPNPWPLGLISILFSVVTGLGRYKLEPKACTYKTKIGWAVSIVRTIGLGISAMLNMSKGDYSGVSSDGFPALISNIVGIMGAGRDYGEYRWALGGFAAMFFGVLPRLAQVTLSLAKTDGQSWLSPFRWSDGVRCIVAPDSYCNPTYRQVNVPYCVAPILVKGSQHGLVGPVEYVRALAWLFVFMLCMTGVFYLFRKGENATMISRRGQVALAYFALAFSVALVLASAITFGLGRRARGLDCRAATTCVEYNPLPCPPITVIIPRSPNGFFIEWAKEVKGLDIPGLIA